MEKTTMKQAYDSPLVTPVSLETEPCLQNASSDSSLQDMGKNEIYDEDF